MQGKLEHVSQGYERRLKALERERAKQHAQLEIEQEERARLQEQARALLAACGSLWQVATLTVLSTSMTPSRLCDTALEMTPHCGVQTVPRTTKSPHSTPDPHALHPHCHLPARCSRQWRRNVWRAVGHRVHVP